MDPVGTLFSAAFQISLDALVKNLHKSITCRRECERLKVAIEKHRPQLVRLAKELDKREQNGQVLVGLDERCTEMKALLEKANEIVHEFDSGRKFYNKVFSAKLAKRIEEIRTLIEERLMHTTVFEMNSEILYCRPATNTLHCLRQTPFSGHHRHGLHVIDMAYADIPLDFEATTFEVIKECLITLLQGIEAQVVEFSRLHSGNHIQVFNHECVFLVDTLSGTVHDRLRRYNNTLNVLQVAGVSDRRRIFMTVAFCIVALAELERMFKAVVDLLTMCSKEDWWNTALELSNTLPSPTIPRWSSFSLAIRSCEWSMDIVDFGFHALEQFLIGASRVTGVVFKWSDKQSRMVLHIDGKPLYHDEGGSSLLDVTRDLEGKDVTALIQKLVDLNETQKRKWFSRFLGNKDTNMHIIADVLSQKLHGPRPDPNSLPYTFEVDPSTLIFVNYIGTGSFGWVAEFKWLGRKVSVKKVKSPGLSRKQFEMEAAILATVQHPRIVRMIGRAFEENKGTGSLVMELMEDDLRHVIEKRCPNPAQGVSPFPLGVAIDIMLQIGEGMQYLREHRILHRDLKAKNVLLNRCRTSESSAYGKFPALASLLHTEEHYIVKLADFGIAKACREQTDFGTMMAGTGPWRAPEVYKVPDAQNYKWPADVYSFAMTCYEILTGCIPFDGVRSEELYKRIVDGERPPLDDVILPPLLKVLVKRCWKTDPHERPNFDEICRTLWQCKVENILPAFRLQIVDPPVLHINQWRNDFECYNAAMHRQFPIDRHFEPKTSTHRPPATTLQISTPSSPRGPFGSMSSYLEDGPLLRALHKRRTG